MLPFSAGMDMVCLLDDSLESEIAMLIMILAATTAVADVEPRKAEPSCSMDRVLVALDTPTVVPWGELVLEQLVVVSKTVQPDQAKPENGLFPRMHKPSKGPAVLTPECSSEKTKKKDNPLA